MTRIAAAVLAVLLLAGCDPAGRPTLTPAFGMRVTDGKLHFWTGSPCRGVTKLSLEFDPYDDDRVQWALGAPDGADVDHFILGEPVPGMTVTQALPADFDWRRAESVQISVDGPQDGWGTTSRLAEVVSESAEHPEDTYWFQDVGWLDPAEVPAKDGKTFLATCTPKPAG